MNSKHNPPFLIYIQINSPIPKTFHCTVRWAIYPLEDNMEMLNNVGNNSVNLNLPLQGSVRPSIANDSNIGLSSSPSLSNNTNKVQISGADDYAKCLLKTVCPDGGLCFTNNVRSTMELTLNCTVSAGIQNAVVKVLCLKYYNNSSLFARNSWLGILSLN